MGRWQKARLPQGAALARQPLLLGGFRGDCVSDTQHPKKQRSSRTTLPGGGMQALGGTGPGLEEGNSLRPTSAETGVGRV